MDPITLLTILLFMRGRGRGMDEMLPFLLLIMSGQNLSPGTTIAPPAAPPTPPTTTTTAPGAAANPMLPILLALMAGEDRGFGDFFRRRHDRDEARDVH